MRGRETILWVSVVLIVGWCAGLYAGEAAPPAKEEASEAAFTDEPQARDLYLKMLMTLRQLRSLSYKSEYRWGDPGEPGHGHCTYTAWLQRPNHFRIEATSLDDNQSGTIVGDGQTLWLFWGGDRPHFSDEDDETYNKTRSNVYMKKPAPPGGHSIGHETGALGVGMGMPIIDPSTFFWYIDSLQPYRDYVRGLGKEKVGNEEWDGIEVSFMKHQRSWYFWISPKDHLPRKLREVVRVAHDLVINEVWSDLVINKPIAVEKFVWTPPEGWQEWKFPEPQESLLKPGTAAPDFELPLVDGKMVKLSDFRDKVVWFYIWRAG
jgi:hypothetical protein